LTVAGEQARRVQHDTRNPLTCCPRCYTAELAGRAARLPAFRFDKIGDADGTVCYRLSHGEQSVAMLSRTGKAGPEAYEIAVEWDADGPSLRARTLRDARQLAEEAYTAVWRDGRYHQRGPVQPLP
jgi:hypothetical protein